MFKKDVNSNIKIADLCHLRRNTGNKTIDYLKKGYKASEISRIVGIHVNTINKVKRRVG